MDKDLLAKHLLESFPNPQRIGCPDDDVLVDLAEGRRDGDEETLAHIGQCSPCFRQYRDYTLDWEEDQAEAKMNEVIELPIAAEPVFKAPTSIAAGAPVVRTPVSVRPQSHYTQFAVAATLLLAFVGGAFFLYEKHQREQKQIVNTASTTTTNDDKYVAGPPTAPQKHPQDAPVVDTNQQGKPHRPKQNSTKDIPSVPIIAPGPAVPNDGEPIQVPTGPPTSPPMNGHQVDHTAAPHGNETQLTIDLSENVEGGRPETPAIQLVTASLVQLHVILPRHSHAGPYSIAFSRDLAGSQIVARTTATANEQDGQIELDTQLDIHDAKAGSLFVLISGTSSNIANGRTITYPLRVE